MRTFNTHSPSNFQIYSTVLSTIVTMLYIIFPALIYLQFCTFDHIHPFHCPHSHLWPLPICSLSLWVWDLFICLEIPLINAWQNHCLLSSIEETETSSQYPAAEGVGSTWLEEILTCSLTSSLPHLLAQRCSPQQPPTPKWCLPLNGNVLGFVSRGGVIYRGVSLQLCGFGYFCLIIFH